MPTPLATVKPMIMLSTCADAIPKPARYAPNKVPHLVMIGFSICLINRNCNFYSSLLRGLKVSFGR